MIKDQKRRYILTGAPGSGKTTIISSLSKLGHHVIHESATDVIKNEFIIGNFEPWRSANFIKKILSLQQKRQQDKQNLSGIEFYDRSPICTYALALHLGYEPSNNLQKEIAFIQKNKFYEHQVFFIENLGFIEKTNVRKISFKDSLKFEKIHISTYEKFGYELIMVPAQSAVKPRIDTEKRIDTERRIETERRIKFIFDILGIIPEAASQVSNKDPLQNQMLAK